MSVTIARDLPEHLAARRSARRRENAASWVALALGAVCFIGAGFLLSPINALRRERQLVINPESIRGLPPDLSLLGKLATFRALAIDWASIRAERLKEQGKNYEAMELHKTVCALAPRFPKVWAHAAWNMAYNISVTQYTPEARWQWVRNGIEILRDEGLVYNPRSVTLYKELSWIYWHKIGDYLDDEHYNYKRALATDMEKILGPPPVALTDEDTFRWFRKIVDSPRDLHRFLSTDSEITAVVVQLAEVELRPDASLLEFVARHIRPELTPEKLLKVRRGDSLIERRLERIQDPKNEIALDRLLAAIRSHELRTRCKLDLDWMMNLMVEQYGPLDWRNAFSHSLYWASRGDDITEGMAKTDPADAMNTARFVFFSLQNLVTRGRLTLEPDFDNPFESYIEMTPDTRFIPYLFATYLRLGKKHFGEHPRFREGTAGPNYHTGLVTSMHNWIELLYLEGGEANRKLAEEYYSWLRENNPHPDGTTQERYLKTVDAFVMDDILDQMQTYRAASAIIRSFLQRALKQFSVGQMDAGLASVIRARQCYDYWMVDTRTDINERRKLQRFEYQFRDEVGAFLASPEISPLAKARLWRNLPLEPRQGVYDKLLPYFERLCDSQNPPWSREVAFAEPVGMDEFRQREPDYRGAPRLEGAEQGERDNR